jgi:putative phosphoesterase
MLVGMVDEDMIEVAVLADTHLSDTRTLPDHVWDQLAGADVILHAGDVTGGRLLDDLAAVAPLHAVLGNNDRGLERRLPDRLQVELGGVQVAMVHDSGARTGRERRMRRWFPDADVVVFGHSHDPVDDEGVDGQRLFNPGSPIQRRRQPQHTMGWLVLAGGRVVDHRIVPLPPP